MSLQYEVNAKVGVDKNDKPIYRKIGVVVKTKEGTYMLKIETIPVIGWDGWAFLNPPKAQEERKPQPAKKQQQAGGAFDDLDDDIPF